MKRIGTNKIMAVVGAGLMGHGIAQTFALAGFQVNVTDVSAEILREARNHIQGNLNELVENGIINNRQSKEALQNLVLTEHADHAIRNADFVVEAVNEDLNLKRSVFKKLEKLTKTETILATNSSTMSISDLVPTSRHPERLIGMHWWNPPYFMRLIEVIPGPGTSKATIDSTIALVKQLGKVPVVCKDSPGFVGNRMQGALMLEAIRLLEEGVASAEEIDRVAKLSLGVRLPIMGPLQLMDFTGIPTVLASSEYLCEKLGDRFAPPNLLKDYAKKGRSGVRTGRGFYTYTPSEARAATRKRDRWLIQNIIGRKEGEQP